MKALKIITVGMLSLSFSGIAMAQSTPEPSASNDPVFRHVELGVRYMPTFAISHFKTSDGGSVRGKYKMGNGAGALLAINGRHLGLQLEVIYNSTSQKYADVNMEHTVKLKYVNIPLLLTLNTNKAKPVNLSVAIGPQLGINVGSSVDMSNNNMDGYTGVLSVKKSDFGFAYGAGLEFALIPSRALRLGIGFRGVYGLIDIRDNSKTMVTKEYFILDRTHMETYSGYIGLSLLF